MISRRTAACQYGSRAECAIIDACQAAPIETSSPDGVVNPLWQARQSAPTANDDGDVGGACGPASGLDDVRAAAPSSTTPTIADAHLTIR